MNATWTRTRSALRKGFGQKTLVLMLTLVMAMPFIVAGTASADFGTSKVLVNQIGYLPLANKVATIVTPTTMTTGTTFKVINTSTNMVVKTGTTTVKGMDNASGDFVHKADFSDVTALGTYRVEVPALTTGGVSVNFVIANDIYPDLPKDAMGYFYFHRLGADLDGFSGTPYYRKAIHDWNTAISCYYPRGNDAYDGPIYPTTIPSDWCGGEKLNVKNAWADAGDFGTYPVNHAISAWTLLNLYEVDPTILPNNSLNVSPAEKTNGVSDLLDEVNFGSTYLRGMLPTNTSLLASHKITNDDFGIRPGIDPWWQDSWTVQKDTFYNWNVSNGTGNPTQIFSSNMEGLVHFENKMNDYILNGPLPIGQTRNTLRYAQPPSTAATYAVARVAAQLARTLSASTDPTTLSDAQKYWATAKDAWQRATTLPTIIRNQVDHPAGDPNSRQFESPGGGDYPDAVITDDKYAAAVEMYLTANKLGDANKAAYKSAVTGAGAEYKKVALFDWQSSGPSGSLSLITVPNDLPAADITSIENNVLAFADTQLATIASEGYPTPLAPIWNAAANRYEYDWGSNALVVNKMIMLGHAFEITKKRGTPDLKYLKGMYQAMDYLMGTNALNISFVTGYGQFYEKVTHDRLAYNLYHFDNIPYPKGWLAGGPNNASNSDGVTPTGLPPAKTYASYGTDGNVQAFASKENTINWNAPLAWVAAYMNANKSYLVGSTLGTSTLSAAAGNASASITWTAATGATSYTLQTSPTTAGTFSNVSGAVNTTALSFNASGLTNGTLYCYRVIASNGSATTTSNVVCVTPQGGSTPTFTLEYHRDTDGNATDNKVHAFFRITNTSPAGSPAVNYSDLKIRYWYTKGTTTAENFTSDYAAVNTSNVLGGTFPWSPAVTGADTYLEIGFKPGPTLAAGANSGEIQGRVNKVDWSNYSEADDYSYLPNQYSFATNNKVALYYQGQLVWGTEPSSPGIPAAPASLTATAGNGSVTLTWPASSYATSYTVYRSTTNGSGYAALSAGTGISGTTFTDTTATNGVTYYYVVRAANSAGSSGNSPQASATPNATVTNLAVQYRAMDTDSGNNQIQFTVSIKNNGATAVNFSDYKIRYYFTSDGATSFNVFCDWASDSSTNQCGNVTRQVVALATPVAGATHYVEIGFSSGMGQVPAGTVSGNVQIRVHKSDWTNFTEAGDYSFDPSKTSLTDWNKVTLLNASNAILWGTAP